jgi:2-(1,2-epoxy-1,2-dihydrophenyl)acetyl-CoA isomerase
MSEPNVLYTTEGSVATITLNRPAVLNALNRELMLELRQCFERARDDEAIRAVVLTGAGRGFASGADLGGSGKRADSGTTLRTLYHPVITMMREMPKPIVAAVNGVAAGAGMSLVMACDIILAGQSASFLQAFSRIGLIPDAGATWFLPRLVGDQRARALAILADQIPAEEAQRMGLVWKVFADDQLMAETGKMAAKLASMPTRAYALIKQTLNVTHSNSLADQLELEALLQTEAGRTEDFAEGVAAFREKRPAQFKGR